MSDQSKDRKQKPLNRFPAAKRNFEFCEASAVFKTPLFWPASSRDLRLASGRFFPGNEPSCTYLPWVTEVFFACDEELRRPQTDTSSPSCVETDASYGCENGKKTFWITDSFILKRMVLFKQLKGMTPEL